MAQKDLFLIRRIPQPAELVGKAVLGDHRPGDTGRLLDIARRAGGDVVLAEDQLLGHPAAEHHRQQRFQFGFGLAELIALRQRHRQAQRTAAGNDRYLMQRIGTGHRQPDQGMSGLVIGRKLFLILGHDHGPPFGAHHDLVLGLLELGHRDQALVLPRRQKGGLVDQVGEIRAGKTGGAARDHLCIHIGGQRHLFHVDLEDHFAAQHIGVRHNDLAVETAGPQQCGIQHVGTVGRSDQDDAFIGFEAVHFDQQLVEGLFAFVVATAETGAAVTADRIDFIDKDDAGGVFLALFEHVADAAGANADEHFNEIRTGNREERHVRFAGDRTGQERLTCTGWADKQHAFRNLAAKALEFLGVAQEFDDFFQFLLGFFDAGDVAEGDAAGPFGQQPCLGLAETHRLAAAALHLAHEENPHPDQQQHREPGNQDVDKRRRSVIGRGRNDHDAAFVELVDQIGVAGRIGRDRPAVLAHRADRAALDGHFADLAALHLRQEGRVWNTCLSAAARRLLEQIKKRHQQQADDDPEGEILTEVIQ